MKTITQLLASAILLPLGMGIAHAQCTDSYEFNESASKSRTIAVNTNVIAKICTALDNDWFKFTTTSAAPKVKITLTTLPADYDVILYSSTGAFLGISQNGGTASETIIYNGASSGASYFVRVLGYNGAYHTTLSYTLRASTQFASWRPEPGSLESSDKALPNMEFEQLELTAFPNPANESISVAFHGSETGSASLSLLDMQGRMLLQRDHVMDEGINFSTLDVSSVPAGLYFLTVQQGDQRSQVRVTVQH